MTNARERWGPITNPDTIQEIVELALRTDLDCRDLMKAGESFAEAVSFHRGTISWVLQKAAEMDPDVFEAVCNQLGTPEREFKNTKLPSDLTQAEIQEIVRVLPSSFLGQMVEIVNNKRN